jgi:uncharacterized membrane protein YeaQ/YmgE (transglycosylase-associated protein family)
MIGMNFSSFLTLLILGVISAIVLHLGMHKHTPRGADGFFTKWIGGWIGGWLGSPVLGHWSFRIEAIYVIPALIGAFVGTFCVIEMAKSMAAAAVAPGKSPLSSPSVAAQLEMKKAS